MKFQIAVSSTILLFVLSCSKDSSQKSIGTFTSEGKPSNDTSEGNQSITSSSPDTPWTFKLFSARDPELAKAEVGIGCGCGPTLANNPAATRGCTIYLITEQGAILPSAEADAVVPFRDDTATCGAQECSKLTEKFGHTTACVPFYGFFDKVDEVSLRLRPESVSDSTSRQPTLGLSALPVEAKSAPVGCGSKGQFSSLQQCLAKQGECMSSGWFYVTGCNYSCDGGGGAAACPRPDTVNINSTPDAFNYGLLSTSGQLGWAVGGEVVQLGKNIGEGFLLLGQNGADCVTGGYASGSDSVLMPCLTTALVAGAIVVSVYFPPAAPYIGYAGTGLATGMAGWNAYHCVAPSNLTMEQSLEYCRKASADLASAIPINKLGDLARNLSKPRTPSLHATATEQRLCKIVKNDRVKEYERTRSNEGNPVTQLEKETILSQRRDEMDRIKKLGYGTTDAEVGGKLDEMGVYFSGYNTRYKLTPKVPPGTPQEMHVVLSEIKKAASTDELAILMGGDQSKKIALLNQLVSKVYNLSTPADLEVANKFVKNADVFFAAVQDLNELRFRWKQIPSGELPSPCGADALGNYQKLVDKYLRGENVLSTGGKAGGLDGVTNFKWGNTDEYPGIIFEIKGSPEGVMGVVVNGKGKVAGEAQDLQAEIGNMQFVAGEKMVSLKEGFEFKVTAAQQKSVQMPDGNGGYVNEMIPHVTVEVVKKNVQIKASLAPLFYSVSEFINPLKAGTPANLNVDGSCPVCEADELAPSDCGTATWECRDDIVNAATNPPMWHAISWCATPSGKNCGSPSMENSPCTRVLKGPFNDGNGVFTRWWSGDWESANYDTKKGNNIYVAPCVEMP